MDNEKDHWSIETLAVRAGAPEDEFGPVTLPISLSSTYRASEPGTYGPWDYARSGNPSRSALEEALAILENGAGAGAFSSGLAAIDAVLRLVEPHGKIIISNDVYGGTWRLLDTVWRKQGLRIAPMDLSEHTNVDDGFKDASLVIIETPSNPMLRILDIAELVRKAHENGALVCVDNTFATPYLQRPLDLGADFVVHSTTKYLGGHSDVIGGAVITRTVEHAEQIHYLQKAVGAVAGPFDAFLVLRGIRTLAVRMERHCATAATLASMLVSNPNVSQVFYPGLASDPGYAVASQQMRAFGGMVSFRHARGAEAAVATVKKTTIFTLAESLGAVESLIELPSKMTHAISVGSPLEVPADLIRLSVGLENVDDLSRDIADALNGS